VLVLRLWSVALVVFILTPILLVILFSFGNNAMIGFPLGRLSWRWYRDLFAWAPFRSALQNSLIVAGIVGLVSTGVGTAAALGLSRMRRRYAEPVGLSLCFPMMLPGLVIGIALLSFYVSVGVPPSLLTVILSHLVVTQPYVILVVYARMATFDFAVVDSARDLGASPMRAFLTITLPIIRTAVVGAALIAAAHSIDDFIITFLTIGGGNTLPTLVWGMLRTTLDPRVNAIATMLIVTTVASTVVALRLSRYRG
jgi:spermidine/putrescine transport system permease protein